MWLVFVSVLFVVFFFFSSRRRHTRCSRDWSSDVCSSDLGAGDRFVFERGDGQVWIIDTRENPNDFPELTESTFARMVCSSRGRVSPSLKAVHVTHAEPPYRSEYDRIFRAPVTFRSHRNALLADDSWMAMKPPTPSRPMLDVLVA